jgi:hypothetical protein
MSITFRPLRQEYYYVPNRQFDPTQPIDIVYNPLEVLEPVYREVNFANVNALILLRATGRKMSALVEHPSGFFPPEQLDTVIRNLNNARLLVEDNMKEKIMRLLEVCYLCRHLRQSLTWD